MKNLTMKILTLTLLSIIIMPTAGFTQLTDSKILTLEKTKQIINAAEERANEDDWAVAIAVVDAGGHLIAFHRIDGTQIGSVEFSIAKAKSAVYYKRETKTFEDAVDAGNNRILNLPNAAAFEGGIPIEYNGQIIGAIGVSGVTSQQDGEIARAGLKAFDQ